MTYVHYFFITLHEISIVPKDFWYLLSFAVSGHNSLFYSYHKLVTISDKAAVSSGVVQSAVRNYINLNIGEQLGRSLLLPTPHSLKLQLLKINHFVQCFGSGSALIWLAWIRIHIRKADSDPGARKFTKINK
jgi:hypothetical protein